MKHAVHAWKNESANRAETGSNSIRVLLLCLFCLALGACARGQNADQVSIGLGQSTNAASSTSSGTDFPIFYVKRTTPDLTKFDGDIRRVRTFIGNADLYMRDRASPSGLETNITARVRKSATEIWDVKDVDVAYDGSKVIFAMRGPLKTNQKDKDPPTWNIWEYVIATDTLHRVIASDVTAEEGQDISPHYTVDGRILFSSTRQHESQAVLIQSEGKQGFEAQDESRTESGFVLHVMDADGGNLHQITFNQSHDLDPTILSDGRIMWSRWDHANGKNGIHLYTANPDGTDVQLLYGAASHNTVADIDPNDQITFPTVQFVKTHEMRNGRILALIKPFTDTEFGGDLYIIDTNTYVENNQATAANAGMKGPAQAKATPSDIRLVPAPSPGGRFNSAVPLWDGSDRILVAWTQCRVLDASKNNAIVPCTSDLLDDPTTPAAPPLYSVWMYDPANSTLQPVVAPVEGVMVSDVAAAQPRTTPTYKPTNTASNVNVNQTLAGEGVGILDIRSVYDFDGSVYAGITTIASTADPTSTRYGIRPARFLRIEKAVSLPDRDVRDIDPDSFGPNGAFMREILGYVPVEPDGSVRVKVPANVAFQIDVLDGNGRRLSDFSRHNAWLSLRPGETATCNGCHTPQAAQSITMGLSGISHGRAASFNSVYAGISAGQTFPGANTAFVATNAGDTMARARGSWSCNNEQCRAITPSVDVLYSEVWTAGNDPKTIPTSTAYRGDFSYKYTGTDGVKTALPTSSLCTVVWSSTCRITIHYEQNIQPIWERPLGVDVNGDMVADAKDTCTSCHSTKDAAGATQVPAGFLDLSGDADPNGSIRKVSYLQLLFSHPQLQLVGGALQPVCLQMVNGVCTQTQDQPAPLLALDARDSHTFFDRFAPGSGDPIHSPGSISLLTSGELRLISEWVDIGAQYYNDPFKAPVN